MNEWSMEHCLSNTGRGEPQCAKQNLCQSHFAPDPLTVIKCMHLFEYRECSCSGVLLCTAQLQIAVVAGVTWMLIYCTRYFFTFNVCSVKKEL
jgi:hypothetical protein